MEFFCRLPDQGKEVDEIFLNNLKKFLYHCTRTG